MWTGHYRGGRPRRHARRGSAIGYAFCDTSSDGVLDVVLNDEFHPALVEVTVDLTAHDQE
jgi:hypothetical protein